MQTFLEGDCLVRVEQQIGVLCHCIGELAPTGIGRGVGGHTVLQAGQEPFVNGVLGDQRFQCVRAYSRKVAALQIETDAAIFASDVLDKLVGYVGVLGALADIPRATAQLGGEAAIGQGGQ